MVQLTEQSEDVVETKIREMIEEGADPFTFALVRMEHLHPLLVEWKRETMHKGSIGQKYVGNTLSNLGYTKHRITIHKNGERVAQPWFWSRSYSNSQHDQMLMDFFGDWVDDMNPSDIKSKLKPTLI